MRFVYPQDSVLYIVQHNFYISLSDFAKELSDKWVQGNVSDIQMIETLINAHKRM